MNTVALKSIIFQKEMIYLHLSSPIILRMETHPKLLGTAKTCWVDVQKLKSMAEQTRKHSFILVSQQARLNKMDTKEIKMKKR